jgi:hypothetical protein
MEDAIDSCVNPFILPYEWVVSVNNNGSKYQHVWTDSS